jgi:excisionase family DNA binding protein
MTSINGHTSECSCGTGTLDEPNNNLDQLATAISTAVLAQLDGQRESYLNVEQAADFLACGKRRIYDLVESERLECRRDGTRLVFKREWLEAVLSDDRR